MAFLGALAGLSAVGLHADFSYEQTSKITGGMMASMMKVVGVFSRSAREPIRTSVLLKGDRMAHATPESVTVIDLSKETITEIRLKQKTYSVMTFAQMAQFLDQMSKKAAKENEGKADLNFKASVKETGQTRQISGLNTHEVILTLLMEGTDKETGNKGSMNMTSNMWMATDVPGYQEMNAFYQRMAQKLAWMPGSGVFTQGRGDIAKAFGDLQKEASKLQGVPVLQTVVMGGAGTGQPGQPAAQPAPKQEQRESPSIGGALGRLGGLGGLGRRKKEEPKQEEQPQPAASGSGASAGAPAGTLLEMTTETTNFSTASVDPSRFEVPAGFKQVENEMVKALSAR